MIRGFLFAVVMSLVIVGSVSADDPVASPGNWRGTDNGVIWISPSTGYLVYTDGTNLLWTKTVDGGTGWSTPTTIQASCNPGVISVWYDRWTKDDGGSTIHVSWHRSSNSVNVCGANTRINYVGLNTTNDVLGTITFSDVTSYAGTCATPCEISITKTMNGNIYIHAALTNSSFQHRFLRSVDAGATWALRSLGPSGNVFRGLIAPPVENPNFFVTNADVIAIERLGQILFYTDSTNTWSVITDFSSGISGTLCSTTSGDHKRCMTRAINTTTVNPTAGGVTGVGDPMIFWGILTDSIIGNPHNFYVVRTDVDTNTSQLTTPVFTNVTDIYNVGLTYSATNNVLYAFYLDSTAEEVAYRMSSDKGVTWSNEIRFDDTVNAKMDMFTTPAVTLQGGRLMPVWIESGDIVTNLESVIVLVSESSPNEQDFENRLDRFVAGIGFRGDSGQFWFAALTSMFLAAMMLVFRAPMMVTAAIVGMWSTLMSLVGFLPFGIYLSAVTVFGIILLFLVLKTLNGSEGEL